MNIGDGTAALLPVNLTSFGTRCSTRPERKLLDSKQKEPWCFDMEEMTPQFRLAASTVSTPPTPPVAATIWPFAPLFTAWEVVHRSVAGGAGNGAQAV